MLMKRFFFYALFLLLAPISRATSIVILVTPDYILMGADSKRMIIDNNSNRTVNQSVCKIRNVGPYCYALAGFVASRSTFFSADSIVQHYLNKADSYEKAIASITKAVKKGLRKELRYQRKHQPKSFKKMVDSKEHLLEIAILSVQENAPHVQIIGFELSNEKKIEVKDYTAKCPGDCPEKKTQFYLLGEYSGIEKYLDQETDPSDPVALIKDLITIQSHTTPSSVGAPINMVRYTTSGVEWIK